MFATVATANERRETTYVINTKTLRGYGFALLSAGLTLFAAGGLQSYAPSTDESLGSLTLVVPTYKFGLEQERFNAIVSSEVARGMTLSELIEQFSEDDAIKANLLINALQSLDENKLIAGRSLTAFLSGDKEFPDYLVYEANDYEQIVFDFLTGEVRIHAEEVTTELVVGHAGIESSLWAAVNGAGYSNRVAHGVTRAIESSIALNRLDKGDQFDMIYERKLVAGVEKGEGRVKMVRLRHRDKDIVAMHFARPEAGINGYYNLEGESLAQGYLLNPVKGSRISSAYNLSRLHPILRYRRPHYGTDYAAPYGRPIMAVANGVVETVSRSRGNGNFVKIKHDSRHATQYLHMRSHAKGLRSGDVVQQGDIIGYVGSTGLSTGPHVCFRFWKDGKQVNHLKIDLPRANPLPADMLSEFEIERDELLREMNAAPAERALAPSIVLDQDSDEA